MKTYLVRIIYDKGKSQRYEDTICLTNNYRAAFVEALRRAEIPDDKIRQVLIHELRH